MRAQEAGPAILAFDHPAQLRACLGDQSHQIGILRYRDRPEELQHGHHLGSNQDRDAEGCAQTTALSTVDSVEMLAAREVLNPHRFTRFPHPAG
jgi:hypothetical protein